MLKPKLILFVIVVILFCKTNTLLAQEDNLFNTSKHRIGFIYSYGNQSSLKVDYNYRVNLFQVQYLYALSRKPALGVDFLVQPQYNITRFRYLNDSPLETNGYEYGLNIGILARKNVLKSFLSFYTYISSGPHYISGISERQSSGFVFSSNISIGFNILLGGNIYLDLRSGYRHISNAGLTTSNGGVNNLLFGGGILIPIL